jgi:amino acid permease
LGSYLFCKSIFSIVFDGGFWEGIISTVLITIAYLALDLSLAEILSIMPFRGGSFGYARCTLGPAVGFGVALLEICLYNFNTICSIEKAARIMSTVLMIPIKYEPVIGLIAYGCILFGLRKGGQWYLSGMIITSLISLVVITLYCIGAMTRFNISQLQSNMEHGFSGSYTTYWDSMSYPMWFYMGICTLPYAGGQQASFSKVISKSLVIAISIAIALSILMVFLIGAQYDMTNALQISYIHDLPFLLVDVFDDVYHLPRRWIPLLFLPAVFTTAQGFLFAAQFQLTAMADSGLIPTWIGYRTSDDNNSSSSSENEDNKQNSNNGNNEALHDKVETKASPDQQSSSKHPIPRRALYLCIIGQYIVYLFLTSFVSHAQGFFIHQTYKITCLAGCVMYMGVFIVFLQFRSHLQTMSRTYTNPLGRVGAIVGFMIFGFAFLGILATLHQHNFFVAVVFFGLIFIMMIYYLVYISE